MAHAADSPKSLQLIGSQALGGAERWCLRFSQALHEKGVPVEVAIRAGSQLDGLDTGSLPLHRLPFRTVWDPWSSHAITRLIRRLRPDIVQTYMGRATRLTRLKPGHGPVHIARLGGYYALQPYRHAHAWIGNTKGICDWMVANGVPAERVFHIYNFADPATRVPDAEVEALRRQISLPRDGLAMVSAARFVTFKGVSYLIDALARLPREIDGRPWGLVLLGDGPLHADLRRQAADSGVNDRIFWAGWRTDPGPFFQMADLVVFPSLDEEPFGNVILEAWAWRKPLVVTRFRGAREVARHGEDAWCVPCADAQALANGIETVLRDPRLARQLAQRGLARLEEQFGRAPILAQYLDLYRRLTDA